jgi:hypothetical protein
MPFQPPPRPSSVLACVLAAASIVLTVAGCTSHLTPLGPTPPQPRHLGSPIVLQAMRSQPATPAGGCPAGYVTLSAPGNPHTGLCYRKLGTPVTLTSAAVSPGPVAAPADNQAPANKASALLIAVPVADVAAVTAVIKQAYDSRGAVDISVAGKTWADPEVIKPFPGQQFEIALPSSNQAQQLYRLLVPSSRVPSS